MLIHSVVVPMGSSPSRETVPERIPDGCNLVKAWGACTLRARCEMWTHPLGWELRLLIDELDLHVGRVVQSADELVTTVDELRTEMAEFGWR